MENLDYVLQRMENRTPENFPHNSRGHRPRTETFSTRSLLTGYKDKGGGRCGCCTCRLLVGVAILVLLAWGIAVPIYFLLGPGVNAGENTDRPQVAAHAYRGDHMDGRLVNGTVMNAVNGTLRVVNQRFTPNLANPFSAEYQAMKLKLETLLSVVFNKKTDFNKAAVIQFRPGSVVVQFVLIFNKHQKRVRHLVQATLTTYLGSNWSMLGTFQVEIGSLNIQNIRNQCAVDNGGCSHLCFWSVLSAGYECRCPQNYRLLTDGKTCFPSELPKATTTANLCANEQFLCRSGNCIPHHWLCDGVSDCLLGEDEAAHLCENLGKNLLKSKNDTKANMVSKHVQSVSAVKAPSGGTSSRRPSQRFAAAQKAERHAQMAAVTVTPKPVRVVQRRPASTSKEPTPPTLVQQSKTEKKDTHKSRGFSFFG